MNALVVTAEQVEAINALLPQGTRVYAMPGAQGVLQLGGDLLTDCGPGGTYEAAGELLESLAIAPWTSPEEP